MRVTVQVDVTRWRSEREQEVVDLLLERALAGDHERIAGMLRSRTGRSLVARGVVVVRYN